MTTENDDYLVERLVPKVLSSIRAKSRAVESFSVKKDLSGITSLPAYDTTGGQFKTVLVELETFRKPSADAADAANKAAKEANDAADAANEAAKEANDAADAANEAALAVDEKISELGSKVAENTLGLNLSTINEEENLDEYPLRLYTILDSGLYGSSSEYRHILIPVSYEECVSVHASNNEARLAWFKSNASPVKGGTPDYVDGTSRFDVPANTKYSYSVPKGANFLYVYLGKEGSYEYRPQYVKIRKAKIVDNLESEEASYALSARQGKVLNDKVLEDSKAISILADCIVSNPDFNPDSLVLHTILGEIGETPSEGTSTSFGRYEIELNNASYVSVSVIGVIKTTQYITFVDSNNVIIDRVDATVSNNYDRITLDNIPVPSTAVKVFVNTYKDVDGVNENYVKIWSSLGKTTNELQAFSKEVEKNLNMLIQKSEISIADYTIRNYTLLDTGLYGTNSDYKHILIPVDSHDSIEMTGGTANTYIAWMKSNAEPISGQAADLVEGTSRITIEANKHYYINAPVGAGYLYVALGKESEGFPYQLNKLSVSSPRTVNNLTRKTIDLQMEMGGILNGETYFGGDIRERMLSRLRTPMFINITDADKIVSINGVAEDEYYYIYCYDENFNYIIGSKTLELATNTAYIKVVVRKNDTTQVFGSEKKISMDVDTSHAISFFKNSEPAFEKKTISFKVELPVQDTISPIAEYVGNNSIARIWDNGYIYLPYNYSRNGKAVPLVIFAHGTGGFNFANSMAAYSEYIQIFLHNGYAVADCSCKSSYYGTSYYEHLDSSTNDSKLSPLVMSCYAGLYKYITDNYNIKTDGVYLTSKSAGGLVTTYMSYEAPFPVKCVSNLAPALSMVGNSWRVTAATALNLWLRNFFMDVDSHPVADYLKGDGDLAFVLENIDKVYGYDPLFKNSDLPFKDVITLMYSIAPSSVGSTNQEQVTNAYVENEQLMAYFNAAKKFQPVPVKNWIASDDTSVPIEMVRLIQDMVRRGNGIWEVRELPTGTGGHHATDSHSNALKVIYKCADGESIEYPVAFAETVDWFNRF